MSRLRRHFKDHWKREVAMLAALGVLITVAITLWLREKAKPEPIANDPKILPLDPKAEEMRKDGLDLCAKSQWKQCIEKLDDAKRLDPAGDTRPEVKKAREDAAKAKDISPEPAPSPTTQNITPPPSPAPSGIPTTSWNPSEPDSKLSDSLSLSNSNSKAVTPPAPAPKAIAKPAPKPTAAPPPVTKSAGKPSVFDEKAAKEDEIKQQQLKKKSAPSKKGDFGGSSGF